MDAQAASRLAEVLATWEGQPVAVRVVAGADELVAVRRDARSSLELGAPAVVLADRA